MNIVDPELLIPLAGMMVGVVGMLLPIAIIAVVLHFRQRRTQQLHDTVKHLADRGQPVPPELFEPPDGKRPPESAQFKAITLIGVGVGLGVMFYLLNLKFLVGIGALLLCIGIAQLIALRIEKPSVESPGQ